MLLAIWCSDKNSCDKQRCSLGWSIKETYEKLKSGQFVFRKNNPNTVPAPRIIKEYLGVDNLTKQQYDILTAKKNILLINGPAGAGKSLILAGRMIELLQSDARKKVVLFRFCAKGKMSDLYRKALDLAGVCNQEVDVEIGDTVLTLHERLSESMKSNQVTVVTFTGLNITTSWFTGTLRSLRCIKHLHQDYSVFIDDLQALVITTDKVVPGGILTSVMETLESLPLSEGNSVIVACDAGQASLSYFAEKHFSMDYSTMQSRYQSDLPFDPSSFYIRRMYFNNQLKSLSANLRNTANISAALALLRDDFVGSNEKFCFFKRMTADQTSGHFIHGPQIVLHVFDNVRSLSPSVLNDIIENEVKLLCKDCSFDLSNIGFIYNDHSAFSALSDKFSETISSLHVNQTFSVEFPAVIVFHWMKTGCGGPTNSEELYLAMSRALVYCVVILFRPALRFTFLQDLRWNDITNRLSEHSLVIEH